MSKTYPLTITVEDLVEANVESVLGELRNSIEDLDRYHSLDTEHTEDVDVAELLARHQAIALLWDADMVWSRHPQLSRDQAWQVLTEAEKRYTPDTGLTWDGIAAIVRELFPAPAIRHWHGRIDVTIADAQACHKAAALDRLRDLAARLSDGLPDVEADVDPDSIYSTNDQEDCL